MRATVTFVVLAVVCMTVGLFHGERASLRHHVFVGSVATALGILVGAMWR